MSQFPEQRAYCRKRHQTLRWRRHDLRTVIGTILIGVLLNGLVLMKVSSYVQQIIIGVIIVLAVAFDTFA